MKQERQKQLSGVLFCTGVKAGLSVKQTRKDLETVKIWIWRKVIYLSWIQPKYNLKVLDHLNENRKKSENLTWLCREEK